MAKRAVVFVHGHMGTPRQFDALTALVKGRGADIVSVTLPGHDAPLSEFVRYGRIDWLKAVEGRIDELRAGYDELILVGHSMGGLLLMNAAVKRPERIRAIIAVALPLYIRVTPRWLKTRIEFAKRPKAGEEPSVSFARAMCGVSGITAKNAYRLMPSVMEFLKLMRETRALLPRLAAPLTVVHAEHDEIVSPRSAALARARGASVIALKTASHFWFPENETRIIAGEVARASEDERAE